MEDVAAVTDTSITSRSGSSAAPRGSAVPSERPLETKGAAVDRERGELRQATRHCGEPLVREATAPRASSRKLCNAAPPSASSAAFVASAAVEPEHTEALAARDHGEHAGAVCGGVGEVEHSSEERHASARMPSAVSPARRQRLSVTVCGDAEHLGGWSVSVCEPVGSKSTSSCRRLLIAPVDPTEGGGEGARHRAHKRRPARMTSP